MQAPFCSGTISGWVRSPRRENLENVTPSFPCRSYSQKRFKPSALLAFKNQQVHACSVQGILRPLQKTGIDERINRFCDLLHVVSHKSGELFICQECARVSIQKQQQVELTRTYYDRRASEQLLDVLRWICRTLIAHNALSRWNAHGEWASRLRNPLLLILANAVKSRRRRAFRISAKCAIRRPLLDPVGQSRGRRNVAHAVSHVLESDRCSAI